MRNDPSEASVRVSYAWDEVNNTLKTVNEDHYYPFGLQHKGYTRSAAREIVRESDLIEIGLEKAIPGGSTSGSANYKYKYNDYRVKSFERTFSEYTARSAELQDELNLNLYDYGARNYDPAIGRMLQIDPHSSKYTSITPYNYVINSPVNFIDPDGKDFRINISQDKNGDYNITFETTINTYGSGSSTKEAKSMQNRLKEMGKKIKVDGNINLVFDISVQHHDDKESAIKATEQSPGDNLLEINENFKNSDFSLYDNNYINGNNNLLSEGFTILGGREGKAKNPIRGIHEIGHFFGLGDRYEKNGIDNQLGFEDDIMSNLYPTKINKNHYQNLYNFIKKDIDFTVKNGDTRTIIYTNVSSTDINKK